MSTPLDIRGNSIREGDTIIFGHAQSMILLQGVVVKINAKTVKIEHKVWNGYTKVYDTEYAQRTFDNVVVG